MTALCGCAGIGRLASLRCLCPDGRTGSTPVSRTKRPLPPTVPKNLDVIGDGGQEIRECFGTTDFLLSGEDCCFNMSRRRGPVLIRRVTLFAKERAL